MLKIRPLRTHNGDNVCSITRDLALIPIFTRKNYLFRRILFGTTAFPTMYTELFIRTLYNVSVIPIASGENRKYCFENCKNGFQQLTSWIQKSPQIYWKFIKEKPEDIIGKHS